MCNSDRLASVASYNIFCNFIRCLSSEDVLVGFQGEFRWKDQMDSNYGALPSPTYDSSHI